MIVSCGFLRAPDAILGAVASKDRRSLIPWRPIGLTLTPVTVSWDGKQSRN